MSSVEGEGGSGHANIVNVKEVTSMKLLEMEIFGEGEKIRDSGLGWSLS